MSTLLTIAEILTERLINLIEQESENEDDLFTLLGRNHRAYVLHDRQRLDIASWDDDLSYAMIGMAFNSMIELLYSRFEQGLGLNRTHLRSANLVRFADASDRKVSDKKVMSKLSKDSAERLMLYSATDGLRERKLRKKVESKCGILPVSFKRLLFNITSNP
ncbi:hypothetical protein BD770DRAFT_409666 [Pilaira anomala]|nr:hypothetical protein BD770DRAFT_409666 [Pilaira anomala]